MQTHSIILGKYGDQWLTLPGQENVGAYAPPRTYKTSGLAAPNAFSWPGSLVVLDIRGELFDTTAGHRAERLNQAVYLLDPASAENRTHRWNPLSSVERRSPRRWTQVSRLAYLLFPEAAATGQAGNTNSDKFWEPSARAAFTSVATMIAETPGLSLDLATVLRFFSRGDWADRLVRMIAESRSAGGLRYAQGVVDGVADMLQGGDDQVEGVRKVVSTRLSAWSDPPVAAATRTSDFDLRDLRRKPMTIYISVDPANMARMRPFLGLFFETLVNSNVDVMPDKDESLQYQTLLIMDEFARLGSMPSVATAAQYMGGYGLRLLTIVQNKAQLEALYGRAGSRDIIDNCGAEILSGLSDLAGTKEASERLGDNTEIAITKQRPRFMSAFKWDRQSEAEHLHRRPFMLPQEVARMKRNEQLIFRAGMTPVITQRRGWFEDPELRKLRLPPPEIPALEWSVPLDDGETQVVRKRARQTGGSQEDIEQEDVE